VFSLIGGAWKVLERLAPQLTSFICTEAYNTPKDRAKIQYGLSIILSEGLKIIFLILFFTIIHQQKYFYFSLCILLSIRIFSGGVHVKGLLNCLLLTTLIFILNCILAPLMPRLYTTCYLIVGILSLVIVLVKAPICSVVRPIKGNKKKLIYKFTAAVAVAIWTIVLLFLVGTPYLNCGFSTIFTQNIQLVLVRKPKM
jgi:accessory gene regulator B